MKLVNRVLGKLWYLFNNDITVKYDLIRIYQIYLFIDVYQLQAY
jgi:hypothetical protein